MNNAFIRNAIELRGKAGKEWVKQIPQIIKKYEEKWDIVVSEPFVLSYNYTARAKRSTGEMVVLKIGFKNDEKFSRERDALRIFDGEGTVKILEEDVDEAVLLLERAIPGVPIHDLSSDEEATLVASRLIKRLRRPTPKEHRFPHLSDDFEAFRRLRNHFNGTPGPLPSEIFETGEKLFSELLKTTSEEILLHGDLHHRNILSATREPYLAIDPEGVIGDPAFETAAFLRNPYPEFLKRNHPEEQLVKRIQIFLQELKIPATRIRDWGITQTVRSAIWEIEDRGKNWEYDIKVAELIAALKF